MKAIVLYSKHESGQQEQAEALAQELGAFAQAIDILEVYGSDLGRAMKDLLAVREFPAVVFVQDHLAGQAITDTAYLQTAVAEQQDIEEREFRSTASGHLQAVLETAKEAGREEIRQQVRDAADLDSIEGPARNKLQEHGILP